MKQKTPVIAVLYRRTQRYVWMGLLLVFVAVLFASVALRSVEAATSSTINFQARLQQANGALVPDGFYNVEFKLYAAQSGGTALWTETYYDSNGATAGNDNRTRVANGYLTINLGSQTAFPGSINWDQELWLTMNVGGTAQTASPTWDGEMTPRLKLTAVPYAFSAGKLQQTTGGNTSTLGWDTQTAGNSILLPNASGVVCLQNAAACGFVVGESTDFIQNGTSPQTADFNITGSATAGSLATNTIDTGVGGGTLTIGGTNADNVTIGDASTSIGVDTSLGVVGLAAGNTGVLVQNEGVSIRQNTTDSATAFQVQNAAQSSIFNVDTVDNVVSLGSGVALSIAGGNTASRPSSPTEGMLYYDTETDRLLVYANGKWQADRSNSTAIVAAADSENKDGADFVVSAADQAAGNADAAINAAIASLPSGGGSVYLMEGTYTIDTSISLPSNTTLTGAGDSTVVQIKLATNINAIVNSDTVAGNTNVKITNFMIDGQSTASTGISFTTVGSGSGASAKTGSTISGMSLVNLKGIAVSLDSSNYNTVADNRIINPHNSILLSSSAHNTLSNNFIHNGSDNSFQLNSSSSNTITDNVVDGLSGSAHGARLDSSAYNVISNNRFENIGGRGVMLSIGFYNTISSNYFIDVDTVGTDGSIYVGSNSDNNRIINNYIFDNTGTNVPGINISSSGSTKNYLSGNYMQGTANPTIVDAAGSDTVYANQEDENGVLINRGGSGFQVQDAAGASLLYADGDGSTGVVALGTDDANTVLFVLDSSSAATDPVSAPDGSMYYNTTMDEFRCRINGAWANCGGSSGGTNFVQGGNSFGATATLGTTDVNGIDFVTNSNTVLGLSTTGQATFKNSTDSATAFQIQNAASTALFTADTTNSQVSIGVADANATLFILDSSSAASDPVTAPDGSMYYNTTMNEFRCRINGSWANCGGTSGGVNFQQGGNSFGTTATLGTTDINGIDFIANNNTVLGLSTTGQATFKNSTDSATAFQIQNATSVNLLTADTSSMEIIIGDTTDGIILSADGLELRGTARNAKQVVLTPEYVGAVLDDLGSTNTVGSMTAGYDSTARMNYYHWTTSEVIAQEYSVVVTFQLPSDWSAWAGGSSEICVETFSSDILAATAALTVFGTDGGVADVSSGNITSADWTPNCFALNDAKYETNGVMTVQLTLSTSANEFIQLGNLSLNYLSKF